MSIASIPTGRPHDGIPAETAAAPHRDGSPSAFAQTLSRLERDMWQGATAGPAPRVRMSRPLAALPGSRPAAPPPVRPAEAAQVIRVPIEITTLQPGPGCRTHAQPGTVATERSAPTSSPPLRAAGNDAPPDILARPLPATSTAALYRAIPAPDPEPAHAAGQRPRVFAPDAAAQAASVPPCRLSVLTGEAGISVAIRAAGIDDAALAQRAFAELRRLGLPDARLFINGRLFIATNPLPGGTHGD